MSIRDDFFAAQAKASLWDVAVSIKRGNPLPLDANSVFKAYGVVDTDSYAGSLLEYASSNPVAYPGQICAVVEENATTIYYLDQNLAIQKVGIIPTSGDNAILVTPTGEISLSGFTAAADNTVAMKNEAGALVWKTLEEIGAGDGNDNTTYEFAFAEQKITITPKFNGQPVVEGEGEDAEQVKYELDLSAFVTETELADAIKDFVTTDTTYSVKESEKVLKLEGTEFSTVLSLRYAEAIEASEGVEAKPERIQLLGIGDVVLGEIDATPFVRDGMLNDVSYNAETKEITFVWNVIEGTNEDGSIKYQKDSINIADLIDTYTAGDGLNLVDNEFSVKVDSASEEFLTVGEAGIKLAGVNAAIEAAEGRAAVTAQGKADAAKDAAIADAVTKYAPKSTVYTKEEIDDIIEGVQGGASESASSVNTKLENYKKLVNAEVWGDEAGAGDAQGNSRIDLLETAVDALEAIGAQANVLELVKGADDNKLVISGIVNKTITIDDSALRTDIANADGKAVAAQNAANTNAQAITGHDNRISTLETAKTTQGEAITALQNADITLGNKITTIETLVNNETSGVAANYAAITKNTTDIAALVAQDKTHTDEIAALKVTVGNHGTSITNINAALENIYTKGDVYTKTEIDTEVNAINNELAKKLESADLADYAKTNDVVAKTVYEQHVADANAAIEANTTALATLIGNDANKSIRTIALDEINTLIKASDPADGKTIEQVADLVKYVDENAGQIAGLITQANKSTAALDGIGEGKDYTTVLAAIDGEIKAAAYTLSVATSEKLGGVLSAKDVEGKPAANSVYVGETGLMTVKKITTDILENGEDELILFGGKA